MADEFILTSPEEDGTAEDDPIPKVFQYFVEKAGKTPRYLLTKDRHRKAELRWKEEMKIQSQLGTEKVDLRRVVGAVFKNVIDEITESEFHRDNGFVEWEQLFSSRAKFDRWVDRWETNWSKKADPRQSRFMELIVSAHKHFVKVPPFIDGVTGVNLAKLLKARPDIDERKFKAMLKNYHNSDDHGRAENPRKYILSLPKYELGALDRFGIEPQVKGAGIGYATA